MLAQWKQNPNLLVSLPATKALCNMDQEYGGHKFGPGIYLLLPNDRHVQHKNKLSNWGVDVVFVHGLMGGVFYTWRQQNPDNVLKLSARFKIVVFSFLMFIYICCCQIGEDNYSFCLPRMPAMSE